MRQLILLIFIALMTASCQGKVNSYSSEPDSDHATSYPVEPDSHQDVEVQQPQQPTVQAIEPISRQHKGPVPILMYHSISQHPKNDREILPQVFREEMEHLKAAGYHSISFKDLEDWKEGRAIPDKPVLITLDDGYLDNYTFAYPVLKKLQMNATIFVVSDLVDKPYYLNWNQIKEMDQSGWIEIGVHTRHHLDLTKETKATLTDEVLGSKRILEDRLGHPLIAFAYPSGRYNDNVVETVRRAGFEFSVTTKPGYAAKEQGLLTLHRVRVSGKQSAAAFAKTFP